MGSDLYMKIYIMSVPPPPLKVNSYLGEEGV